MLELAVQEAGLELASVLSIGLLMIGILCVIVMLKDGDI